MPNYSLILSKNIAPNTKYPVFELEVDGISVLDKFRDDIDGNAQYSKEFAKSLSTIENVANGASQPPKKWKQLVGTKCKCYEAKTDHLRIYLAQLSIGRTIILGGVKTKQKPDIKSVEKIVKELEECTIKILEK